VSQLPRNGTVKDKFFKGDGAGGDPSLFFYGAITVSQLPRNGSTKDGFLKMMLQVRSNLIFECQDKVVHLTGAKELTHGCTWLSSSASLLEAH
jgi:hypothetical protein